MLKFGIIGAGGIAHSFYDALKVVEDTKLVAVASKSISRAREWIRQSGIEENQVRVYGDYDEFLNDSDIDVVYIATTVNYHYENIKACLNAGKHVICEKAMVETYAQAEEVFKIAKEKNLFLMEAMWSRFAPRVEVIRKWIADGKIGTVELVQATIGFVAPKDPENRLYNKKLGGGALYDIGVYVIDMIPFFIGKNIIETDATVKWSDTGIDETIQLNMKLEDDIIVNTQISFDAKMPEDVYIYGNNGYLRIPKVHYGRDAYLYDNSDELIEYFEAEERPGFSYEIEEVKRCIEEEKIVSDIAGPDMTFVSSRIYDKYLR